MAKNILYICTFIFNFIVIYGAISAFDDILDDVTTCEERCMKLYGTSNISGSETSACSRGCRLYTITRFITADEPSHTNSIDDNGLSPAKLLCQHSCTEAYNETSSKTDACKVGCDMEEAAANKKEEAKEEVGPSIHLLKPLMEIREVTSKVIGMLRIVQTSLTTYFMREDNSVVAVEGPVHVMVQLNPNAAELDNAHVFNVEGQETAHIPVLKEKIGHAIASEGSRIEFVSRKLSCLMVISIIIFFVILFGYILVVSCCKKDKKLKELHETSNKMKFPAHVMPVKLVRPEDLTKLSLMDEEDSLAPGLQTKIKLPDNTVI